MCPHILIFMTYISKKLHVNYVGGTGVAQLRQLVADSNKTPQES